MKYKKAAVTCVKVVITVLLLYLIITKIGVDKVEKSLSQIGYYFFMAIALAVLFNILKAFKWHYLLTQTEKGSTFATAARSYLVGMVGGFLTPARIGEVGRMIPLREQGKSLIVSLVAVDKLADLAVVLMLSIYGAGWYFGWYVGAAAALLSAVSIAIFMFPYYPLRFFDYIAGKNRFLAGYRERWAIMASKIQSVPIGFKFTFLILTIVCYVIVIIEYHWLISNYQVCRLSAVFKAQPLIMLTNTIPLTIGGLGVREGSAIVLLGHFGISSSAALSSAFMLFLLNTAVPAVIGGILLFSRGKSSD